MSVVMNFEESAGAGVNKVAASNSRINIVQQESVCFRFKLLNQRNNHNLQEGRVAEGVEEATVY